MIIQTIDTASQFRDAFHKMDRGNQFSYEGFQALFDYLEEITQGCEPLELDPIALCCDFSEYTIEDLQREYPDNGTDEELLEYLQNHTHLIPVSDDTFIIQSF
jgi:hypothetical protein